MIRRFFGALVRSILVMFVIMIPTFFLPTSHNTAEVASLIAFFAALLTFFEYSSVYPSLIEFRDSPPVNRVRFGALLCIVLSLCIYLGNRENPTTASTLIASLGGIVGHTLDFQFSPIRLMIAALPEGADQAVAVRTAGGIVFTLAVLSMLFYIIALRLMYWPRAREKFNIWTNLPTFDPTATSDVVSRLRRDATLNIILGFLLPFLIPLSIGAASTLFGAVESQDQHSFVWLMTAWVFLPMSLFMRGVAMNRVAAMIHAKRHDSAHDYPLEFQSS